EHSRFRLREHRKHSRRGIGDCNLVDGGSHPLQLGQLDVELPGITDSVSLQRTLGIQTMEHMMMGTRKRSGFTLAEVLVTIAIIAIMAAVLLPALNSQLSKGDTSRIASDLTNLQSGIQAFVSDLRRYPSTTTQQTQGATGNDILGAAFTASDAAAWKG